MNLPRFIALRLFLHSDAGKRVSRPAVLIATVGVAVGLAVMIVSVSVIIGFKRQVRDMVVGFGSHIQVANVRAPRSYEARPVEAGDSIFHILKGFAYVKRVQRYSTKPGMIKTADAFLGMVLKGVGPEYDLDFFRRHLLEGEVPQFGDTVSTGRVLLSCAIADKLKLKVGDKIDTYYIEGEVRARRLEVAGIYRTNFSDYDNLFLLTDLYTVNRLNGWQKDQASGLEVALERYGDLEEATYGLGMALYDTTDRYGEEYCVRNVEQLNPQIFAWLGILNVNIWVILILMAGVAGFTMVSGLLIIIIERTSMIGTLKSLGAGNTLVRRTFLWLACFLIGRGMVWGDIVGVALCLVQRYTGLFRLDPETYYMDAVPVSLNIWALLLLNIGTLLVSLLMLVGPSFLVAHIRPATSMRYE
ncbi:MAG: ABC transporter permease [Prevotellaceae bacterium]|nr:ABC transporter permease [Prevotellaceae bacterium]